MEMEMKMEMEIAEMEIAEMCSLDAGDEVSGIHTLSHSLHFGPLDSRVNAFIREITIAPRI